MPPFSAADPAMFAFVALPVGLAVLFVWGVAVVWRRSGASAAAARRAAVFAALGAAGWMAVTDAVARSGVLRQWDWTPPPIAPLVVSILALAAILAAGRIGRRFARWLPLWVLVAVQGFRLPLELAMHDMYVRGVMPVQMSYDGRNFDVLTGAAALVLAPLVASRVAGRRLVAAWNAAGLALLINIVGVAILSVPRIAWFGDDQVNVWVTYPPYVWLPTVMVLAALAGHLVIFRALRQPEDHRS